jgi:hypothetical protein
MTCTGLEYVELFVGVFLEPPADVVVEHEFYDLAGNVG